MKTKTNLSGVYVLIVFSMIFWGMSFVFSTIVLKYMDPFTILFIRLFISCVFVWLLTVLFYRKYAVRLADLKILALLAFFEPFLYFIGETFGLQRVSPTITALIISTIPVFTAITMFVVYHVTLLKINIVGIALSFLGVVFMILGKDMEFVVDGVGLLLLFLAVFSAVCYGLVLTKVSSRIHPVWIISVQNTFSLLMFLPLMLIYGDPIRVEVVPEFHALSPQVELWGSLTVLAVFCSTLAFIFYTIAVKRIGITRTSIFTNLIPVITAIVSFFLLQEKMTVNKLVGMLIIVAGVMLSQWKKKQENVKSITN